MELSCEHPCRGRAQMEQQPDIYNNTDVTTAIFQHARKMAVMNACAQRANVMPRGVPCHRRLFSVFDSHPRSMSITQTTAEDIASR